jgi:lipopolysaccharide export system permease protein
MIKIIDKLLIKSFLPPLVVTFFIATFILVLQFLWVWIDEIAGKGIGFFTLIELIYFATIRLIPMSLPISVLLAGVMVMGNLGEKNELSSFKSAGVSLLRVIRPLLGISLMVGIFSFVCSNYIIPYAHLKYFTRLYEIRTAKPTLNLQPGLFNLDFKGYAIHIKNKKSDGQNIEGVTLYNLQDSNNGLYNYMFAKKGKMYSTQDQNFFIMELDSVYQIQELAKSGPHHESMGPQILRSEFAHYTKVFDMSEFKLTRRDEDNFKNNQQILSVGELGRAIDTLGFKLAESYLRVDYELGAILPGYSSVLETNKIELTRYKKKDERDSLDLLETQSSSSDIASDQGLNYDNENKQVQRSVLAKLPSYAKPNAALLETDTKSILFCFDLQDRNKLLELTKSSLRNSLGGYQVAIANVSIHKQSKRMHYYTLHEKFSLAIICIIFLLIGAPMGAIVRKGGFGYSFLVSVIFFVVFIMLTIAFKKITESSSIHPVLGAYMPCLVLLPISLWVTFKAMNDQKLSIDLSWKDWKKYFGRNKNCP